MSGVKLGVVLVAIACVSCAKPPPYGFLKGARLEFTDAYTTSDGDPSHNDNYVVERAPQDVIRAAKAELVDTGKFHLHPEKGADSEAVLTCLDPMTHEARTGPGSTIIVISAGKTTKEGVLAGTSKTWATVCVTTNQE